MQLQNKKHQTAMCHTFPLKISKSFVRFEAQTSVFSSNMAAKEAGYKMPLCYILNM
jgi:hypothetical protein